MNDRRLLKLRLVLPLLLLASFATVGAPSATADPAWAPAATAPIHPGVQTVSPSGQCTSNFVFTDGTDVFIGQAAHCTTTGGATDTNGCMTQSLPLGTEVEVQGASEPAVMVYNSWIAMQEAGETDQGTCIFNDFALLKLNAANIDEVNPSIPHWGGPVALNTTSVPDLSLIYSYGNSSLRLGLTPLSPKIGIVWATLFEGWDHQAFAVTPGIPGDSGSAVLDANGNALGIMALLGALGNGIGDLNKELQYMAAHSDLDAVQLAPGTEPFNPAQLPLDL
jgi:hypothetical protein